MDRFASNTLRTLGIVAVSIVVIIGSLALLLLALCAGMFGGIGGLGSSSHHDPQTVKVFYGSILAAVVLVIIGVLSIAKLAKGIVRESTALPAPQAESQSLPLAPSVTHDVAAHLSPASRSAIHTLVLALAAQIGHARNAPET